ncbi:hypothetical protein G3O06_01730 [Burkholderia sp. Ac-20345]|uniref:hypothetical protein n=1 Tax=Burkholderia sp. Ac-20345 TaxID=2703891 RepID=UPI00197B81CB|nr:hypothetical protein [Burkholderia sp. Ac-20345]MBN3776282.1 hypothetical protein [Burkholderia sp. Ac-20345]
MLTLTQVCTRSIPGAVLSACYSERGHGRTLHSRVARWQLLTGMHAWGSALRPKRRISVATLISSLILSAFVAEPTWAQERVGLAKGNEMSARTVGKPMTDEQQAALMHFAEIGLKWVSGEVSFDEVVKVFGKPDYQTEDSNSIQYAFYPEKVMSVRFTLDKLNLIDGRPRIGAFSIKVNDGIHTDVPYDRFEKLGLRRVERGESIDGVRAEQGDFFYPAGVADVNGTRPRNYATFSYRLPLSADSPFDVYAGFGYLGDWINEASRAWTLSNFRNAVDLRILNIARNYLTPAELQQREQAKRQKYGEMNLRTGMPCPETGVWQGFAENCTPDVTVVWKGRKFPSVRTLTHQEERDQRRSTSWVDGQWMWLREFDDSKPHVNDKGI